MSLTQIALLQIPRRERREDIKTLDDAIRLIESSSRIIVLSGAGISVSCGVPDFRSENGIYSRMEEYELSDPQEMFDIDFFKRHPGIFYKFAKDIHPADLKPSITHAFIKLLESKGKLLRNYTQNVDALELMVGIERLIQCHGSFATASCVKCRYQISGKELEPFIQGQTVMPCPRCVAEERQKRIEEGNTVVKERGRPVSSRVAAKAESKRGIDEDLGREPDVSIMKPDIVFFGEKLPNKFDKAFKKDRNKIDLLLVIGSSLKVAPVALVKDLIPPNVPQIIINMEYLPNMANFDVVIEGHCDEVVTYICKRLKWKLIPPNGGSGEQSQYSTSFTPPNRYQLSKL
ncbi:NAD-dependent protein deacetylase sirtuin-1 [Blyttiomyces sp. JEL0837]|nr:NAD-dependent protein deacetylase sirtuin-1 [Blyttiomyces sp. JEL0837]